jgi:hypothetical protein
MAAMISKITPNNTPVINSAIAVSLPSLDHVYILGDTLTQSDARPVIFISGASMWCA